MRYIISPAATIWLAASLSAQQLPPDVFQHFRWRSVGPANMGGRIVDIAGIPAPSTVTLEVGDHATQLTFRIERQGI